MNTSIKTSIMLGTAIFLTFGVQMATAASAWVEPVAVDNSPLVAYKRANAPRVFKPEADEQKSPLGCKDVGYLFDMKVLNLQPGLAGDKQSLYFLFNKRAEVVHLHQMLPDDSTRNYFLNSEINPGQWGALSTFEPELRYICTVDDANFPNGKIVDCADSLKVCEYANVKYGLNNKGNFWLVKSNTRGGAVYNVLHYGIIPR